MSRFFRQAGDTDSESEDSGDELMSSGNEEAPAKPAAASSSKPAMARFLRGAESTDSDSSSESGSDSDGATDDAESDDEEKPGVRIISAQEKRLIEMEATGKVMENALKINDWGAISTGTSLLEFNS